MITIIQFDNIPKSRIDHLRPTQTQIYSTHSIQTKFWTQR